MSVPNFELAENDSNYYLKKENLESASVPTNLENRPKIGQAFFEDKTYQINKSFPKQNAIQTLQLNTMANIAN